MDVDQNTFGIPVITTALVHGKPVVPLVTVLLIGKKML
jgi:hypothetical protein